MEPLRYRLTYRIEPPADCPIRHVEGEVTDLVVFRTGETVHGDVVARTDDGVVTRHYDCTRGPDCLCSVFFDNDVVPRVRPTRSGDDELVITTYTASIETAWQITAALRDAVSSITVLDAREFGPEAEWVTQVDMTVLTDRQRDAVRLALDAGYYETPRASSERELASMAGVSRSAFSAQLRTAEREILSQALEGT